MKVRYYAITSVVVILIIGVYLSATSRTENDVFQQWLDWQNSYQDYPIEEFKNNIHSEYWHWFSLRYNDHKEAFKPMLPFLQSFTHGYINESGELSASNGDELCYDSLCSFYEKADHDTPKLIEQLKIHQLASLDINKQESESDVNSVINKYKYFAQLLCAHPNQTEEDSALFSLSNRFFEFCFSDKTWDQFKPMLADTSVYPINRFLYSTMWYHLVGDGWRNWSTACLDTLKQKSDQGKEIVYVAGGVDIRELLKHGIYNVTVIDPMLPSQGIYYTDGWEWLIKGTGRKSGKGDQVALNFDNKKLTLVRVHYKEQGEFEAKLSTGALAKLHKSITQWEVHDDKNKTVGKITFDRRFCDQNDFKQDDKKVNLVSFNEMYYIALPKELGGWGIDAEKFADNQHLFVKQLRNPVDKKILAHIKDAEKSAFKFIKLGSCST